MAWDLNNLATLSRYSEGGPIPFRDDSKGKIIGIGNIKLGTSLLIKNIVLIVGLKHNLLSVSQFCDKGFNVVFDHFTCDILDKKTNTCVLFYFRENNVYMIDMLNLQCNATCLNILMKILGYDIEE